MLPHFLSSQQAHHPPYVGGGCQCHGPKGCQATLCLARGQGGHPVHSLGFTAVTKRWQVSLSRCCQVDLVLSRRAGPGVGGRQPLQLELREDVV